MTVSFKLTAIEKLGGTITLRSGLHIGSGDMEMHIGGTDSPVIKHPHTLEPYIPGSSIKGKLRSLLEIRHGLVVHTDGKPVSCETLNKNEVKNNDELKQACAAILKIFGSSRAGNEDMSELGPTRASFNDCFLEDEWKKKAKEERLSYTEVKSENSIDRIRGTATNPRFIERVPEGTRFKFLITFKILQEDDRNLLGNYLLSGLKLLEMDSLGGNGSRGYGRIEFEFDDNKLNQEFKGLDPFKNFTCQGSAT